VKICGKQVRKRGEILLDVDSTDDPTYGQQQLSFFNGGFDQHMYHPLLIFERHTGCLFAARLRPGKVGSYARIIPLPLTSSWVTADKCVSSGTFSRPGSTEK